ncbi:MAG: bifunctional oligoribonuclease/PAP phosphatase NrnA [Anaerolineae bacterium]|nr:bifunctional oligoribonuclease/PAP phosphatase NrnA [Anaerolineae bacterium]
MSSFSEMRAILAAMRRALIVSHISPDGDTIGSALALAWALRSRGIEVHLACADPVPTELRFLPGSDEFAPRLPSDEDAIFVLDTSDTARIGAIYDRDAFDAALVINIDHHVTNICYGDIDLVSPQASTAELVLDLVTFWGIAIDQTIASCLLTGIVTDTRGFATSNTTAQTLRAAAQLMEAGADLHQIVDAVFNHRTLGTLRLWGAAFSQAKLQEGILWVELSQSLMRSLDAEPADAKGLANFLSTIDAAAIVVLRETEDGAVDVSFRSKPALDLSTVAIAFGGGGHAQAAGCLVIGSLDEVRERILGRMRTEMALQEVAHPEASPIPY